MDRIRVYFNKYSGTCQARIEHLRSLDHLGLVDFTTDPTPQDRPLPVGDWLVENVRTGRVYEGPVAIRMIYLRILRLLPLGLMMFLPGAARWCDCHDKHQTFESANHSLRGP